MEGSRRSSTALLVLLLLAPLLAASSTTAAAAAQRRHPPTEGSYKLITYGDQAKLAVRADGSSIAGFANNKNDWFAIQGSEDLLQPYRNRYGGGGGDIPGQGLHTLLGGMLKKK